MKGSPDKSEPFVESRFSPILKYSYMSQLEQANFFFNSILEIQISSIMLLTDIKCIIL